MESKDIADEAIRKADEAEDRGDLASAQRILSDAVEVAPDVPRLRARYGRLLHLDGQWREAIVQFDAALAIKPKAASTLFFRGRAKSMLEDMEGAIADFETTLELQPESYDALYEMAMIRDYQGRWDEALVLLRRIQTLSPETFRDVPGLIATIQEKHAGRGRSTRS